MQHDGFISDCAISQDSKHLITVSHDWTLRIWDMYVGKELAVYKYGRKPTAVTFASGCGMFAVGVEPADKNSKATCYIYDFDCFQNTDEALLRDFSNPQKGNFTGLAFSIDNTYLYLTDDKGYFHIYVCMDEENDTANEGQGSDAIQQQGEKEEKNDEGSQDTKDSGTAIAKSIKLHNETIMSLKLSRDKSMALVTSIDQSATLLDIRDGKNIRVLQKFLSNRPLRGGVVSPI
uniref:Serine-threonine kinase receptor-associated protein n=1 Tax=Lygus hesperus TaxID=30085 RepID=A0A0A9WYH0_LYGHE